MSKTVLISGASSGFGALTARALAGAGYRVYAGMRDVSGHNKAHADEAGQYSRDHGVALTAVELDVTSEESVKLRSRAGPVRHRDLHHRAWIFHPWHQSLREQRQARGPGRGGRVRGPVRRADGPGGTKLRELEPPGADVAAVAQAILAVVQADKGTRPFRVHIDPADDGAAVVNAVADHIRAEFLRRIDLADLLHPSGVTGP